MTQSGRDPFSQLLYPMLRPQPAAGDDLILELASAPIEKSAESNRLRLELLDEFGDEIVRTADEMAAAFQKEGRLLALGNGGSATSAADMVTEMLVPSGGRRPIPAICLTNDIAVITAIGNDVGFGDVFVRQIIALGRPDDVVLAVSTSGNSENLVRGLGEARRRGMSTIAICGYDGGRLAREQVTEHCFIVRSSSVHRIQEVQMTLYHLLAELVLRALEGEPACA
ncbi:MAG TPA: SIS domain-containing protein [Candidatus Saccharimonadales bacterium]|nr:SIS domain-containing protein [Candidatus Saccharimonadales bacterium]